MGKEESVCNVDRMQRMIDYADGGIISKRLSSYAIHIASMLEDLETIQEFDYRDLRHDHQNCSNTSLADIEELVPEHEELLFWARSLNKYIQRLS